MKKKDKFYADWSAEFKRLGWDDSARRFNNELRRRDKRRSQGHKAARKDTP